MDLASVCRSFGDHLTKCNMSSERIPAVERKIKSVDELQDSTSDCDSGSCFLRLLFDALHSALYFTSHTLIMGLSEFRCA